MPAVAPAAHEGSLGDYIPLGDATLLSGKAESSIRLWIKEKKIEATKDSLGRWLISRSSIRSYLAAAGTPRSQVRPQQLAVCDRSNTAAAPAVAASTAVLESEIQSLKAELNRERSERQRAMEAVYQLQEQVVSLSSKVVGLLETAGNLRNRPGATTTPSASASESSALNSDCIDIGIENMGWVSTVEAERLTGVPRQTWSSRAKKGTIRSRSNPEKRGIELLREDLAAR